ncbi:MAG TPA: sialidase family protein, partial [Candidatus Thermoplasmatota archaeon]|nr:sialidase family protein [Candidatus Thermoplasmatota archaeon]
RRSRRVPPPRAPLLVLALLATPALLALPAPPPRVLPPSEAGPVPAATMAVAFAAPVEVEPGRHGAEPGIDVAPDGCVYVNAIALTAATLWRSCGGAFERLARPSLGEQPIGGYDTDLALDARGTLYYSDLWVVSASIAASDDRGATWTLTNPAGLLPPLDDRQWLLPLAPGRVLHVTHELGTGILASLCVRAPLPAPLDAMACAPGTLVALDAPRFCVCPPGHPAADPSGRTILVPMLSAANELTPGQPTLITGDILIQAGISRDGGLTWKLKTVARGAGVPAIFPASAIDAAGTLYVTWAAQRVDGPAREVWLARSVDGGATWSETQVSEGGTNVLPWIAAREGGRVALAWYHADVQDDPEALEGDWTVAYAESRDADAALPVWDRGAPSEVVHRDDLCVTGAACLGDRDLLDFLGVAFAPDGAAWVAWADDVADGHDGHAHVWVARQA